MWKLLFAPEILFLGGMIQSLLPYIIWSINGLNRNYSYTTTYIPILIWIAGYLFFWIGSSLIKDYKLARDNFIQSVKWSKFNLILVSVFVLTCIFILQAINIYGGIPLIQYASEVSTVADANNLQNNASSGQFGILLALLFFLNPLILLIIIRSFESGRKDTIIFLSVSFIEIFGGLMAGKRQAMMITSMFIACGLSLHFNDPFKPLLDIINIPKNNLIRLFLLGGLVSLIIWIMGAMIGLRTGNATTAFSGIDEILTYLELPLINLESQCEAIGLGFEQKNFAYPFIRLLPYGLIQSIMMSAKDLPYYPEPTASAGFYGELHWGFGLYGIILFSFIAGLVSKYLYTRASYSIFHFLAYCQISWTLISAHSYNHFLTLMFIPVPTLILFLFSRIIDNSKFSTTKSLKIQP